MRIRILLAIMLSLALAIALTSCSDDSSDDKKPSVSGTILLLDQTDHSGVTVALYSADVNTEVAQAQEIYSNLGPQADWTVFDHRLHTPLKTVETNASGEFKFSNLNGQSYIVVVFKAGYGYRYFYDVVPGADAWPSNVTLSPEIDITVGEMTDGYTFEANRNYIIHGLQMTSGAFVIEPGAWLRIEPDMLVAVLGSVDFRGTAQECFHVTSNDRLTTFESGLSADQIEAYYAFRINDTATYAANTLEHGCFNFGYFGLQNLLDNLIISHCAVSHCSYGLISSALNQVCSNLLVYANNGVGATGLTFNNVVGGSIYDNLILSNRMGASVSPGFAGEFLNNLVQSNINGLEWNQCMGTIENNEFLSNTETDLFLSLSQTVPTMDLTVRFNRLNSYDGLNWHQVGSYYQLGNVEITYNEFLNSHYFMIFSAGGQFEGVTLDTTHNYFNGLSTEAEIKAWVDDIEDHSQTNYPLADVSNFYSSPINDEDIGIQ